MIYAPSFARQHGCKPPVTEPHTPRRQLSQPEDLSLQTEIEFTVSTTARNIALRMARMKLGTIFLIGFAASILAARGAEERLPLARQGKPECTVILAAGKPSEMLLMRAAEAVSGTVRKWAGVDLPTTVVSEASSDLPSGPAIVLITLDRLHNIAPAIENSQLAALRAQFVDDHGFACFSARSSGGTRMFVVGRTPRGIFNGAIYVRDFLIDGSKDDLYVRQDTVVRSPGMGGRGVYLLTVWGNEAEYRAQDWLPVLDSFARDGMDRVYFWVSGHFPSKLFPASYKVADILKGMTYDSTAHSGIPEMEDQRKLIRHAHEMGLKFYLGGGLGGWVGTVFLTGLQRDTFKQNAVGDSGGDQSDESLCPSHPKVRDALIRYYKEMFDALPEADGLYIESADEMGACHCHVCSRVIDEYGSTQYGQAQLSLIQQIMQAVWRDHPHAHLAYSVGYDPHKHDPAFYEAMRQMADPRLEWIEARGSYEFPGPEGKLQPAPYFSPHIMAWRYHDGKPLKQMIADFNRLGREAWYGAVSTFSPGFSSGSLYHAIPLPTDEVPYVVTHFVHRELTWEPALSEEAVQAAMQKRFFGQEAPPGLSKDLWELRELNRTVSEGVWGLDSSKHWAYLGCRGTSSDAADRMREIERDIQQARPDASPKTVYGLDLMIRSIRQIRNECGGKGARP